MNRVFSKSLTLTLLIASCAVLGLLLFGSHGAGQLNALKKEEQLLQNKNRNLQEDIVGLKNNIYAVQRDSFSLEKTVRTELGMAKPGEVIYVVSPEQSSSRARLRTKVEDRTDLLQSK